MQEKFGAVFFGPPCICTTTAIRIYDAYPLKAKTYKGESAFFGSAEVNILALILCLKGAVKTRAAATEITILQNELLGIVVDVELTADPMAFLLPGINSVK